MRFAAILCGLLASSGALADPASDADECRATVYFLATNFRLTNQALVSTYGRLEALQKENEALKKAATDAAPKGEEKKP